MLRYLVNGVIVGVGDLLLPGADRRPLRLRTGKAAIGAAARSIFAFVLLGLLIPPQVTAIPLYIMLWQVGLLDTYAAWSSCRSTISVFGIFLMRQFFRTVPDELIHAARLDGLSRIRDRLAHHGADGDAGAGLVRHLLVVGTGTSSSGR